MSGGWFNYTNDDLCDEVTGVYPMHNLSSEEQIEHSQAARILNKLEDKDISAMAYDFFCLLHSYDWYICGDTGKEDYEADIKEFKERWFSRSMVKGEK